VRISAKTDYAVRAAAALAAADGGPIKGETLATTQGIPQKFLENILSDMRHAGLIRSQRGADGG
jgi:Rrf2 family protein